MNILPVYLVHEKNWHTEPTTQEHVCLFVFSLQIISLKPSANLKKKVQNHVGLVEKSSVTFNKSTFEVTRKIQGTLLWRAFSSNTTCLKGF